MKIRSFIGSFWFYILSLLYPLYEVLKNFEDSWTFFDFLAHGFVSFPGSFLFLVIGCFLLAELEDKFMKCPKCDTKGGHKELGRGKAYSTLTFKGLWQCWMCKHNWYPAGNPKEGVECPKCNKKGGTFIYDELVRDIHKSPPNSYPISIIETLENCFKCSDCGHEFLGKEIEYEDQNHKNK